MRWRHIQVTSFVYWQKQEQGEQEEQKLKGVPLAR